ncbi:PAAR domain-containing protein [Morganella psychrotolerans]|uniref:PAAR domain-containing protein n=1 Tax=Morganella psychrotolerans TaxID=368603 RepID=UPI0039AEFC97
MSDTRPNIFGKAMALDGDKTTTGATCIATSNMIKNKGTISLRVDDLTTTCPKCEQTGKIVTGDRRMMNDGKAQAVDGSIVQCGCPYGANTVIAATPQTNAEGFGSAVSQGIASTTSGLSAAMQNTGSWQQHISPQDITDAPLSESVPRYTVTIYTAAPGTPLNDDRTGQPAFNDTDGKRAVSEAGHMWIGIKEIKNNIPGEESAYGFGPVDHGMWGDGQVVTTDSIHYEKPYYRRTIEITEEQYKKLDEFGELATKRDTRYFDLYYNGANNSCIDFANTALRFAGFNPTVVPKDDISTTGIPHTNPAKHEGTLRVLRNIPAIKLIPAPFPDSELNEEKTNEMPERTLIQEYFLSQSDSPLKNDDITIVKR